MPDAPDAPEKTDRQVWGAALRALRLRSGKTLSEASAAYEPEGYTKGDPDKGVSVQRWQQIEKGGVRFTPDQRKRLVKALDASPEELDMERARILGHRPKPAASGMEERESRGLMIPIWGRTEFGAEGWKVKAAEISEAGFDLRDLSGPSVGVTYVPDDTMLPKAKPGALVIFDRSRRPVVDGGCVVETQAGELYPRMFVGEDKTHILVRSLKVTRPVAFKRDLVKGVYLVRFWGD